jgi:hypothetical protein
MKLSSNRRRVQQVPTRVGFQQPGEATRRQAEHFVHRAFVHAYDADIATFMPTLMTLRDDQGVLRGVLGLRHAAESSLFLEHYLDAPAECVLSAAVGMPVARASVIEVGNFAVGAAGGGRWLITALTAHLHCAGYAWAVFTCGPELRNAFRRLGIPLIDIAPADPARLTAGERLCWGRYYDQAPRVMAANVARSHAVLSSLFEQETALRALWHGALQASAIAA